MPNYSYTCQDCESISDHIFSHASRPDNIKCACGGISTYTLYMPNINGKTSYLDGKKRKGWQDMKEISKLKVEAASSRSDKKKEIAKEIKKLGGKTGD